MVVTNFNRKLYKIPKDEILDKRREFYGLKRISGESIEEWLDRICSHMDDCCFPESVEYILTDKFVCELSADERQQIRNADINWSMIWECVSTNQNQMIQYCRSYFISLNKFFVKCPAR